MINKRMLGRGLYGNKCDVSRFYDWISVLLLCSYYRVPVLCFYSTIVMFLAYELVVMAT